MSSPLWDGVREGCGTCAFGWRETTTVAGKVYANTECRRYPPQLLMEERMDGYGQKTELLVQRRPSMADFEWCGEYKRRGT